MNIAVVQFAPMLGRPGETRERIRALSVDFAGCDLVVLPELANSGYAFVSAEQAWELSEDPGDSLFVKLLSEICRRHRQHIVTGFNERHAGALYNSALLVGPDGVEGLYRKLHLFLDEKDIFRPGDVGLPTFEVAGCRLGLLICFDWRFPEVWRALALAGVDVICHPSNLVTQGLAQRATPVHAMVNHVYVATANRVGTEGSFTFTGRSQIVAPSGEILAEADAVEEKICRARLDLSRARDKFVNRRNHLFNDRRPEVYGALLDIESR